MTLTLSLPDYAVEVATPDEIQRYVELVRIVCEAWEPMPHQEMPSLDEDWDVWAMVGGRGIGKTDGGAAAMDRLMRDHPRWRGRIIAPTLDDAKEACVDGPTGLKAHNRALTVNYNDHIVLWPNGSRVRWYGMDKPDSADRLRAGGNVHVDWFEELAAQQYAEDGWVQADLGRRLGERPRVIVTTTPKKRAIMRWLLGRPLTGLDLERHPWMRVRPKAIIKRAATNANRFLEEAKRALLEALYGGTRLGKQELEGDLLDEIENALWSEALLERYRVQAIPDLVRVVVGVDPAATSGPDADETGIVVAGKGVDARGYALADRTCRLSPDGWGRRVVQACIDFGADCIVVESNQGGEMCEAVIRTAAQAMGVTMPRLKRIHAVQGKMIRAEPVAALYEQGRVSHVGVLAQLEDEMTSYTTDSGESPGHLDAAVHALTELMVQARRTLSFRAA